MAGNYPTPSAFTRIKTDLPVLDESNAGDKLDQLIGQQVLPPGNAWAEKVQRDLPG